MTVKHMDAELLQNRCDALLIALVGKEDLVSKWWNSQNKAFDKTPREQFDKDPKSVYNYLMRCAEGEW